MNNPTKQMMILLAALFGVVSIASGAQINVTAELSRLKTQYASMKPSQELIISFLDQLQVHCKNEKKIEVASLNNASMCVEQYMNSSQTESDVNTAVAEGRLDDFFRSTCLKWPKVKVCLKEFFDIIENCWPRGDKVTKIVDESVKFLCGEENDGGRIAVFFADGGMKCLEQHGDGVKQCMGNITEFQEMPEVDTTNLIPDNLDQHKDEICEKMEQMAGCASKELKKCDDTTPENLVTSMLQFSSKSVGCDIKIQQTSSVKASSAASGTEALIGWVLTTLAAGFFL